MTEPILSDSDKAEISNAIGALYFNSRRIKDQHFSEILADQMVRDGEIDLADETLTTFQSVQELFKGNSKDNYLFGSMPPLVVIGRAEGTKFEKGISELFGPLNEIAEIISSKSEEIFKWDENRKPLLSESELKAKFTQLHQELDAIIKEHAPEQTMAEKVSKPRTNRAPRDKE